MTGPTIPDAAIEAAGEALLAGWPDGTIIGVGTLRAALAAAYPLLVAAELEAAADDIQALHPGEVKNSVLWLRERAARIARTETDD